MLWLMINPCKSKSHSCDLMPMPFMFNVPYVTSALGGALSKQNKIHLPGVMWEGQRCRGEPCWAALGRLDSWVQSQTTWRINTRGHCRVCTYILGWMLTKAKGEMYLTSWTQCYREKGGNKSESWSPWWVPGLANLSLRLMYILDHV